MCDQACKGFFLLDDGEQVFGLGVVIVFRGIDGRSSVDALSDNGGGGGGDGLGVIGDDDEGSIEGGGSGGAQLSAPRRCRCRRRVVALDNSRVPSTRPAG